MIGQIIKIISNLYTVKANNELYECHARGKFRNDDITPVVGDYCQFDAKNNYIMELLPRRNSLSRPNIANVDIALIVTSLKEPDLSLNLLDKQLTMVLYEQIKPIICFTKADLLTKKELKEITKIKKYYEKIGFKTVYNYQCFKLMRLLKHKTVVVAGQTGAGKSSLLNCLDKKLDIKTAPISKALGRGKHTTSHVELYAIKTSLIADTPGFSALSVSQMTPTEIKDTFIEFSLYPCPYRDCQHLQEPDCEVIKAIKNKKILNTRYENYQNFIKER